MIPGNGNRIVADMMMEISFHVVQPYVYTTLSAPVSAGLQTVAVGSIGTPTPACYAGAQLVVIDSVNGNEVITLTGFNATGPTITANFQYTHPAGTTVYGATFPLQQATDPIFTQSEIISYIARAQNEFLSKVPLFYQQTYATALFGQIFQSAPANMVEMERVALSQTALTSVTLDRSAGVVTATFPYDHNLTAGQTFTVYSPSTSPTFLGAFSVSSVSSPTVVTYLQDGSASTCPSASLGYFNRMYEATQEETTMFERTWRNDTSYPPTAWFEDRAGNYRYGLNAKPQSNFPVNLLYSVRDNDTLSMIDGFVVPDCMCYIIKWKAMEFLASKDGVFASPSLAKYCKSRFDRGVLIAQRFFDGEQGN